MSKFKVGDKVRVLHSSKISRDSVFGYYGIGKEHVDKASQKSYYVITHVDEEDACHMCNSYKLEDNTFNWAEYMLKPYNETQKERSKNMKKYELHITSDGTTTNAVYKEDGRLVNKVYATCNHKYDDFDFKTGTDLCVERLFEERKESDDNELKIGDKVKVVDSDECYTTYIDFAEKYLTKKEMFGYGRTATNNLLSEIGTVYHLGQHEWGNGLAIVKYERDGRIIVIGIEGLEKVK